jgi:hypothetical protein
VGGPAGFEVQPDGHYYALGFDAAGGLVRETGFTNEGHTTFVPQQSGPDIVYANAGFTPLEVQLSADGSTLSIFTEAGPSGPYVASKDAVAVLPTEPVGAREGAGGCQTAETDVFASPTSTAEAVASVAGTWTICGAASSRSPALGPTGTVGIEFDSGGTWAFLVATAGSTPVPSTDPGAHGTYAFQMNGYSFDGTTPNWQLDMQQGNGTFVFGFATSQRPVKLQLLDEAGDVTLSAN